MVPETNGLLNSITQIFNYVALLEAGVELSAHKFYMNGWQNMIIQGLVPAYRQQYIIIGIQG